MPPNIQLADPEFHIPADIEVLLGEHIFYLALEKQQIRLRNDTVILQRTRFGWIVSGKVDDHDIAARETHCYVTSDKLDAQLSKFWDLEADVETKYQSSEERACEEHYVQTTCRDQSGRYIVRLPFNTKGKQLESTYNIAMRRFYNLETKLCRNPELHQQYSQFINEYLNLGHMTNITTTANKNEGFYLPHHAIFKETSLTTKLRVVFDGSATCNSGISLNETLMVGPTLQDDLLDIIIRFRSHAYAFTADVEKMYRQVLIHPDDRRFQKIVWRKNKDSAVETFELNTITYGTACAPYLAIRTLQQLAEDEEHRYPLAAKAFKRDFYVDDLLTGASTVQEAQTLHKELINLASRGGFNLRQWISSEHILCGTTDSVAPDDQLYLDSLDTRKTLGVFWNASKDIFSYSITKVETAPHMTKRKMLSNLAQLFDPLGLVGPVVVKAKLFIQMLWKLKIGWDELVPNNIQSGWHALNEDLKTLENFVIPRGILIKHSVELQLHGFCDASERAYGACLYVRSMAQSGHIITRLICAKSRVAPVKPNTIPRLELCAAVLLTKLYVRVARALELHFHVIKFWSDSTIVLQWIATPPYRLKTFVANRVSDILNHTQIADWKHVPTTQNPADSISRGQSPTEFIRNHSWLTGPSWLAADCSQWPRSPVSETSEELPELKVNQSFTITKADRNPFLTTFSSFGSLQRVCAYCLRFINNASGKPKELGSLSISELRTAHNRIIIMVQQQEFPEECQALTKGGQVNHNSKLLSLTPFLDNHGLIRVGGRLKHANIKYDQKFPLVLPRSHHITKLIIRSEHCKNLHAGIQATLNAVRQQYWPINGKNTVREVCRKCIICFKSNPPKNNTLLMGNLPANRVTARRPFENVGIDYCGPFFIKERRNRNTKRLKVYVSVFVCFATKAVHLELVSDMTTEAFLASLRRFFARRGFARNIYSDNGSNFVGAKNEIYEIQRLLASDDHCRLIEEELIAKGIQWHFSPPRAPHFGGLWEAAVRSFKSHLVRTVGDALFTFEQLNTYIIEIEAILNSRPLTPLSSDPNDLQALTPAHFLIGEPFTSLPEHNLLDIPSNKLSQWQHIQCVSQHFWKRWYKEYLNQLTTRSKWNRDSKPPFSVGTLVLIKEDNLSPRQWKLGRVIALHPGDDQVIRVATVKTISGTYKRASRDLYPLPLADD